jgi:hypothetical protein
MYPNIISDAPSRADCEYDAWQASLRAELRDDLFSADPLTAETFDAPNIDCVLAALCRDMAGCIGPDWQAFRDAAATGDDCEMGRIIEVALDVAADRWMASAAGDDALDELAYARHEQEHCDVD